jgi:thioredoxin-related protein
MMTIYHRKLLHAWPKKVVVKSLSAAILLAMGILFVCGPARGEHIQWRSDYDAARKEAQAKNRPLILDFQTENCLWCKKLDGSTFQEGAIVELVNNRFIALKLDADQNAQLARALRITSYPTLVLAGPDGKILATLEGYVDAPRLHEHLQRTLNGLDNPPWMTRDYEQASKAVAASDYARAIALLKSIGEDGKDRAIQVKARQVLVDLEQQAADRLQRAKQLNDKGHATEAAASLSELVRSFAGTQSAGEAGRVLTSLSQGAEIRAKIRAQRARELLALAKEDYRAGQYLYCLERCEVLTSTYGDLLEASEASQLSQEIKNNPEWLQHACDTLTERLCNFYLIMSETRAKRGETREAIAYLERIIKGFPGTRQCENAQTRLAVLTARQTMQATFSKESAEKR